MQKINCLRHHLRESFVVTKPDPELQREYKPAPASNPVPGTDRFVKCKFQPRPVVCSK